MIEAPAPFTLSRLPRVIFGPGRLAELPALAASYGSRALLVTGRNSFTGSSRYRTLAAAMTKAGLSWEHLSVCKEPSPQLIDDSTSALRGSGIQVVIGIGGGSVLDAAKAIAGLLPFGNSVLDHLEGVGRNIPYHGPGLPFIAVPTTAGTGSEATKNAVLSVDGAQGYKKSFRHESLIPEYALIDPELLSSCPPALIAADGMDAFTQLLESYVSLKANPFTDALAWSGLEAVERGFFLAWQKRGPAAVGEAWMAYAALLSGITLAQTGLGSVHGLAPPLGAFFPIPHGVACGTLVATATEVNIVALRNRAPTHPALAKYARVGRLLTNRPDADMYEAHGLLVERLGQWTKRLALPRLAQFGVREDDIDHIVANSRGNSMTTNPVLLTDEEIASIVRQRL